VIDVEHWAEIRRMHLVERLSIREIARRTGPHRETVRRALASERPPACRRRKRASAKLDPFKEEIERAPAVERPPDPEHPHPRADRRAGL
jgi:transposase